MFKMLTFRSDGAFWPLAERSDFEAIAAKPRWLVTRIITGALAEMAARRAMRELASLDDRTLKDIGIEREQIWFAARYGRNGPHTTMKLEPPHW